MCYYIYFVLPEYADLRHIRPHGQAIGLRFYETSAPGVENLLEEDELLYGATGGDCDCGTWLGSAAVDSRVFYTHEARLEKEAQRLACRVHARAWILFFRNIVEARGTDRIGLILWWAGGGRPRIQSRLRIPIEEVDLDLLACMDSQRVYEFYGTPPPMEF